VGLEPRIEIANAVFDVVERQTVSNSMKPRLVAVEQWLVESNGGSNHSAAS
jgi:hypothetical protein